jgi:ribose/xylose/arabinose/galactoside ABC-type transport system permease subunit
MHERARIGVVASPGYDAEARVLQLALDANGTFDLVGCTSGLERSKVPNSGQIMNILRITAFLGIVSAGQTLVVLSGGEGIDLSVGSTVTLSAVLAY